MLKNHNQDEWNSLVPTTNPYDGSAYKLYRRLLNKPVAQPFTIGRNGLLYTASESANAFADTFQEHFSPNHGAPLPEFQITIHQISDTCITQGNVEYITKHVENRKTSSVNKITNTTLKNM